MTTDNQTNGHDREKKPTQPMRADRPYEESNGALHPTAQPASPRRVG